MEICAEFGTWEEREAFHIRGKRLISQSSTLRYLGSQPSGKENKIESLPHPLHKTNSRWIKDFHKKILSHKNSKETSEVIYNLGKESSF